jgi:hypothetical protein
MAGKLKRKEEYKGSRYIRERYNEKHGIIKIKIVAETYIRKGK